MSKSFKKPITFYRTVTSAEATATKVVIDVKSGALTTTDPFYFICDYKGSDGVQLPGFKSTYSRTTGLLTVANDSSAVLALSGVLTIMGIFGA